MKMIQVILKMITIKLIFIYLKVNKSFFYCSFVMEQRVLERAYFLSKQNVFSSDEERYKVAKDIEESLWISETDEVKFDEVIDRYQDAINRGFVTKEEVYLFVRDCYKHCYYCGQKMTCDNLATITCQKQYRICHNCIVKHITDISNSDTRYFDRFQCLCVIDEKPARPMKPSSQNEDCFHRICDTMTNDKWEELHKTLKGINVH